MSIEESSGNLYRDFGFDESTAQTLQAQSNLLIEVVRIIRERNLTHDEAAQLFGVSVADIKEIEASNIARFPLDMLIAMLSRVGVQVTVTAAKKAA